jgi:hypothetical protein
MRTKNVLPIAGTVAAVTAVAVTIALVQPGEHQPRPLRLAAGGATSGAAKDAATLSAAAPSGSGYTLTGSLPAGRPHDLPAYTLAKGPADADVVAALARALHAGTPARTGAGWRAGGLFVSGDAGQSWWFAPCAADTPVTSGEQVACAIAIDAVPAPAPVDKPGEAPASSAPNAGSAGTTVDTPMMSPNAVRGGSSGSSGSGRATGTTVAPPPTPIASPAPEPMSKDAVRAAAKPVFDALGLGLAEARVEGSPYGGSVTLTRTVGGLEAYGLQTSVQVDRDGKVQNANGWLGTPARGDTYPLVTAQDAYDRLPPMMTAMLCPVGPDGKGCGVPQPTEITGAHLGLMLSALVDGGQALVPAWLFEVKGWTEPLPVVAVQPKYLPEPSAAPTTRPEPGASTEPGGAVPPAPPASSDPGAGPPR